jgi:hypothetical protein
VTEQYEQALATASGDLHATVDKRCVCSPSQFIDRMPSLSYSIDQSKLFIEQCERLRQKLKQIDNLAKVTGDLRKQLDFMVRSWCMDVITMCNRRCC